MASCRYAIILPLAADQTTHPSSTGGSARQYALQFPIALSSLQRSSWRAYLRPCRRSVSTTKANGMQNSTFAAF
eukprot:364478-Chlamydomonas_euryale.AAC.4